MQKRIFFGGIIMSLEGGLSNKEASELVAKYAKGETITVEKYNELLEKYKDAQKAQPATPVQPKKKTSPLLFIGIAILIICII